MGAKGVGKSGGSFRGMNPATEPALDTFINRQGNSPMGSTPAQSPSPEAFLPGRRNATNVGRNETPPGGNSRKGRK